MNYLHETLLFTRFWALFHTSPFIYLHAPSPSGECCGASFLFSLLSLPSGEGTGGTIIPSSSLVSAFVHSRFSSDEGDAEALPRCGR